MVALATSSNPSATSFNLQREARFHIDFNMPAMRIAIFVIRN